MLEVGAPLEQHAGAAELSAYATSSAFCAASCACSHAAGSVSVTPRATTSRPSLMSLGIMRNSTFAMLCCLRPEMSIRVNQDTIHCAALRAQKSHAGPALCPEGEYRPPYP